MTDAASYRFNAGDGTFTVEALALPEGATTIQDAIAAWGATNRGQVTGGAALSWLNTYGLPSNTLEGAEAIGVMHWPTGAETIIVLGRDADIGRLQGMFPYLVTANSPIAPTFDTGGKPATQDVETEIQSPSTQTDPEQGVTEPSTEASTVPSDQPQPQTPATEEADTSTTRATRTSPRKP